MPKEGYNTFSFLQTVNFTNLCSGIVLEGVSTSVADPKPEPQEAASLLWSRILLVEPEPHRDAAPAPNLMFNIGKSKKSQTNNSLHFPINFILTSIKKKK
jgi:hypothetical protein